MKGFTYLLCFLIGYFSGIYTPIVKNISNFEKRLVKVELSTNQIDEANTSILKSFSKIAKWMQSIDNKVNQIKPNKSVIVEIKEIKLEK